VQNKHGVETGRGEWPSLRDVGGRERVGAREGAGKAMQ